MFDWLFRDEPDDRQAASGLPASPQLTLINVCDDFLALHNGGTTAARRVRVDQERSSIVIVNRADRPFDLEPGESWTFVIDDLGPWTEDGWQVTLRWEGQEQPVCVPLSAGAL
jgi:hypothetical protein